MGIFWVWVLTKLSSGIANMLAQNTEDLNISWLINFIFSKFISVEKELLFVNKPPTLSLYFILVLTFLPFWSLVAASNQTASDIRSKYLRFLIPRCTRAEIFSSRFFGAIILINASFLPLTIVAALISLSVDLNTDVFSVITYSFQITFSIFVYVLPFIAIMAFMSAWIGSASLSALIGISLYSVLALILSIIAVRLPQFDWVVFLKPTASKAMHLQLDAIALIKACGVSAVHTILFISAGWLVFKNRDI